MTLTSQSQLKLDWGLKEPESCRFDGPWPHPVVPKPGPEAGTAQLRPSSPALLCGSTETWHKPPAVERQEYLEALSQGFPRAWAHSVFRSGAE